MVAKNPFLHEFLSKAKPIFKEPLSIAQVSFHPKKAVENHILMCGDSAGLIHPLCGNGMAMAIHSAKIASELVDTYLNGLEKSRKNVETKYQGLWIKTFGSRLWMGRQLQAALLNENLSKWSLSALTKSPPILRYLIKEPMENQCCNGFKNRNTETEWMDLPNVKKEELKKVFHDINRANRLLNGNTSTVTAVYKLIKEHPKPSYTILDMGCGDGAILRELVLVGRKKKIPMQCIGLDLNENALELAKSQSLGFPEIRYEKQDIMGLEAGSFQCDILICTLTMHHFDNEQIAIFLEQFTQLSRIGIVINDLQRSRWAYYLFQVFSAIFIQTKMAKHDGGISIKSGFSKTELVAFSKTITKVEHDIRWKWAFRYVWVMRHIRLS